MDDLTPLPPWRQRWNAFADRWAKGRKARQKRLAAFMVKARAAARIAISLAGAMLVAAGVYQMFVPAGYIAGGLLLWVVQWSADMDKQRGDG